MKKIDNVYLNENKRIINKPTGQGTKEMLKSKRNKNDEFYTTREDIERELRYYFDFNHFENKIVFLNCDDPKQSQFWFYFEAKFDSFKIKKLIATHYGEDAYALIIERDENGKKGEMKTIPLKGNGDFRSAECIEFLKESDVVVTNPPFSLFREYIKQLMDYNKKFLVIGAILAVTYKEIFPLLRDRKIWFGHTSPKSYIMPDKSIKKFSGNTYWYTNLENGKRKEKMLLYERYKGNEELYPKYDNYEAININRTHQIPCDYDGVMGVPITFMLKWNPEQFEIVHFRKGNDNKDLTIKGGVNVYLRILIKRK